MQRISWLLVLTLIGCSEQKPLGDEHQGTATDPPISSTTSPVLAVCGDGIVDPSEDCDVGAPVSDDCCTDDCLFTAVDTLCRAGSGDLCDPDEVCDGGSASCPADVVEPVSTECLPGGTCGDAQFCTGMPGDPCPEDPCGASTQTGLVVSIIESESHIAGQDMDARWQSVATGLGHTATIHPQTALDDLATFSGTDILLVTNALINLPSQRLTTLQDWVSQGGALYVQSEYQCTEPGSQAFEDIVNAHGGDFQWLATVSGQLAPVAPVGCVGTNPRCIGDLEYHWYGCDGSGLGDRIAPWLSKDDTGLAWTYCPAAGGIIMSSSDQDWIKESDAWPNAEPLMENVLDHLASAPSSCPI